MLSDPFSEDREVPETFACLKASQPPRRQVSWLVRSKYFQNVMFIVVLVNCATLVIFEPEFSPFSTKGWVCLSMYRDVVVTLYED